MINYLKRKWQESGKVLYDDVVCSNGNTSWVECHKVVPNQNLSSSEIYKQLVELREKTDEYLKYKYSEYSYKRIKEILASIEEPTWKLARSIREGEWKIIVKGGCIQQKWVHSSGKTLEICKGEHPFGCSDYVEGLYPCSCQEDAFILHTLHQQWIEAKKIQEDYERKQWCEVLEG